MKPRSPFFQPFEALPDTLPIYTLENALLPGGELPLELASPAEVALFIHALRHDQLVGMLQPKAGAPGQTYSTGCAGRIRQYRERKDGRLNVMLTGICRYRVVEQSPQPDGFTVARVDWTGFANDYDVETVERPITKVFEDSLRSYFKRHNMQADWETLKTLPIEQVLNNLILILNMSLADKQQLLESPTVTTRLQLFSQLLDAKTDPIIAQAPESSLVN